MSNVLARFRKTSDMEFFKTGQDLLHELRSFLMNEKNIPKRQRMIYTYPIINLMQCMIDTYVKANKIYAYTPEQVMQRKDLFQAAIDYLDPIYLRLQSAVNDLWKDTLLVVDKTDARYNNKIRINKHIALITALMIREEELLRGCKRKTKLLRQ
jgi:hypothetical protein